MAKHKYTPLPYYDADAVVDKEAVLIQAARTIDSAVELALESRDIEQILTAAALWMKLSEEFVTSEEEEVAEEDEEHRLGFHTVNTKVIEVEDESEEE